MDTPSPETTNAVVRLADTILSILAPILVLVLGWLARRAAGWFGVKTDEKQLVVLDDLALRAVHYAEEQARKATAALGAKVDSASKLNLAVDFLETFVKRQGWATWTRDKLVKIVEAKLHIERSPATITTNATVTSSGNTLPPPIAPNP